MAAPDTGGAPSWSSVLAELESAVADAEQVLPGPEQPDARPSWSPPTNMGPLPEELRGRAAALLERQAAAGTRLDAQLASLKRRQRVVTSMNPSPTRPAALYIDRSL